MDGPTKKKCLLGYLARGVAMLHLDARRPGVAVPPQHQDDAHLRLNLSYRYAIPDLVIDEQHVQATLSFSGRPFQVFIPWEAVFGVTSHASGDGQVWPEDLPTEVASSLRDGKRTDDARPRRPSLVPVPPRAESPRAGQTPLATEPLRAEPTRAAEKPAALESPTLEKPPAQPQPERARRLEAARSEQAGDPERPPDPPRRGHLRLVR